MSQNKIQTLPENTRQATMEDLFELIGDRTFLKNDIQFFQKTANGFVEKISNPDMAGPNLFRAIQNNLIFVTK